MTHRSRVIYLGFLLLLVLGIGLAGGVVLERQVLTAHAQALPDSTDEIAGFKLISEAWNIIQTHYVEKATLESNQLIYGAISGMVDALGDTGHSRFMSPEVVQEQHSFNQGAFEGIGTEVQYKDGFTVVVAPFDGSPAQKAGVKAGYIILNVDGEDVTSLRLDQVVERILGPAGTSVRIIFLDPDSGDKKELTITRARIKVDQISWMMIPGTKIAHLRLTAFSNDVSGELKDALKQIRNAGASGIVLDLRNNPGGLLDEAVKVTSQFLKEGYVLQERDANENVKKVPVRRGGIATDIPLVVLINNGSASASEIVSGALQDAGRATLVGETTFGTGTVLNEFTLSDNSSLLLATEEWLTPNGRLIWHQGIKPDIEISLPDDATALSPKAAQGMSPEQWEQEADAQLLKALETILTKVQPASQQVFSNLVH